MEERPILLAIIAKKSLGDYSSKSSIKIKQLLFEGSPFSEEK